MRCVDSELTGRYPQRDSPVALPSQPRSGHAYTRRRNILRRAKGAGPTPIVLSRRDLGLLLLAALLALALLVVLAPGVILVASGGLALALVLSFPVRALSRFMSRPLAVAATFLVLISSTILAFVVLVPLLSDQLRILLGAAPTAIDNASRILRGLLGPLAELGLLSGTPNEALNQVEGYVLERLRRLAGGLLGGLALVMVIQGALSGVGLWVLGVPYAILLGAWVALTAIVPYVGAVVGAIPALITALLVHRPPRWRLPSSSWRFGRWRATYSRLASRARP
jgi:predicted PurR-regulated permease PerM